MSSLKYRYENACNAYLSKFCSNTGLSNDGWVVREAGGVALVGDYFIGMQDLISAVESKIGIDEFLEWYDYCLIVSDGSPNLRSWLAGCPRKSEEELEQIEATRKRIMELEGELEKMLKG